MDSVWLIMINQSTDLYIHGCFVLDWKYLHFASLWQCWGVTLEPQHVIFDIVCVSVCRRQEDLVLNVRRRLEEALMADSLAHIEDVAADAADDKVEKKTELLENEEL